MTEAAMVETVNKNDMLTVSTIAAIFNSVFPK